MADLNIVNVSDIKGRTTSRALTNSSANVLVNTFGNSKVFKVNNILISNKSANTIGVFVDFEDLVDSQISGSGANTRAILHNVDVPNQSTLEALSKSLYLEEGDRLTAYLETAADSSNLVITISYEELS